MTETQPDPEVREALLELQRYLSDHVAPLMVADSIEMLVSCPPQLAATAIEAWVATQYRGAANGATLTDYLFHAMKKINMMAQLRLIDPELMKSYVEALGRIVAEMCPPEDRETFQVTLKGLGQAEADLTPAVQALHMRGGAGAVTGAAGAHRGAAKAGDLSEEVARGLKRFSLLIERLERGARAGAGAPGPTAEQRGELMNQILATAALNSRTGADMEQYLQRLSQMGIEAGTDKVFRALGSSLPGWALVPAVGNAAGVSAAAASRPAEAMRKLVSMAGSPVEGLKRFNEMVQASVEQFNEGNLGRAAAMFEVAGKLVSDRKVDVEKATMIRSHAHQGLSAGLLREFAEQPEKQPALRKVLNFFPALNVAGLLTDLDGEGKRERRKLLLALLEAHGSAARSAALERLTTHAASGNADPHGYFARNLIFLLRRIPRPGDEAIDQEIALLGHLAKWENPLIVIKEAIGALGQLKNPMAEQVLMARMQEYEGLLRQGGHSDLDTGEMRVLLDRIASALARMGTPNAWRTVVNHALRRQPELGESMARLSDLAGQDLSSDRELSEHLIATLRAELPKKVLGFVVSKKNDHVLNLVHSLSGTQTPAVKQLLGEIADRYPDQEFGRAASKALAGFTAPARPAETPAMSLSGDLDLFGLPTLLQTVADAHMSGQLLLTDREGRSLATADFDGGHLADCRAGALTGEAAFYQIIERPVPGTFQFKSRKDAAARPKDAPAGIDPPLEVLPAMLEAMRRHDEFQQAKAMVPDDACLKPTGVKPTGPADGGEDPAFLRAVWEQVCLGATPTACEAAVPADSYRIRRLYAHWIEQGAAALK